MVVDRVLASANSRNFSTAERAGCRIFSLQPPRASDRFGVDAPLRHNKEVCAIAIAAGQVPDRLADPLPDHRLRKHADYQRVYREGRKQFSASMSYFYALRAAESTVTNGPRVGLTVGKVLGKAVDRNRIKRRMRDIVRRRVAIVHANADIILHPRRTVLTVEFAKLESEVVRIFTNIQSSIDKGVKPAPPKQAQA